ncbi:unnamed protein product, partial [Scytosiphon promiscuus]
AVGKRERRDQPWFVRNVVDHRSAWCGLRDAGERAGLREVLHPRPWGDLRDPSSGARQATQSQVLELLSSATQSYLARVLKQLVTVAWQRRGGLSDDLLRGVEARMEDPGLSSSPAVALYSALVPTIHDDDRACFPACAAAGTAATGETTPSKMPTKSGAGVAAESGARETEVGARAMDPREALQGEEA